MSRRSQPFRLSPSTSIIHAQCQSPHPIPTESRGVAESPTTAANDDPAIEHSSRDPRYGQSYRDPRKGQLSFNRLAMGSNGQYRRDCLDLGLFHLYYVLDDCHSDPCDFFSGPCKGKRNPFLKSSNSFLVESHTFDCCSESQ